MKGRLKLDELKVKSFITNEFNDKIETVKGGRPQSYLNCPSLYTCATACHLIKC